MTIDLEERIYSVLDYVTNFTKALTNSGKYGIIRLYSNQAGKFYERLCEYV